MSIEVNKALIRRGIEVANRGNLTELLAMIDELFAPDFVFHDSNIPIPTGGIRSREDYKQFVTGFQAAIPGQFTIEDLIAEGDKVGARYTYRGTNQGQWRGVPPTGKAVTFTGTITYRIVDGKAVEAWQNADNLSVLRQLGILPPGM
jgi:predicted ester cyclase